MGTCPHEWPSSTQLRVVSRAHACARAPRFKDTVVQSHVPVPRARARPQARPRAPRCRRGATRFAPVAWATSSDIARCWRWPKASTHDGKAFLLRSCTCGANGNAPVFLSRALVLLPAPGRAHDPRRHTHPGQPRRARPRQRDEPGGGAPGPTQQSQRQRQRRIIAAPRNASSVRFHACPNAARVWIDHAVRGYCPRGRPY